MKTPSENVRVAISKCSSSTFLSWQNGASAHEELRRLRAEVTHLRMENDILKKAAVILGTQTPSRPAR